MKIVVFEDGKWEDFLPLVYFRPVWKLLSGATTLAEKIKLHLPGEYFYSCRDYLIPTAIAPENRIDNIAHNERVVIINTRVLIDAESAENIKTQIDINPKQVVIDSNNTLIWTTASVEDIRDSQTEGILNTDELKTKHQKHGYNININDNFNVAETLWDLIEDNSRQLTNDISKLAENNGFITQFDSSVSLINSEQVFVHSTAKLMPQIVLDATKGPILIDENATIMPCSYIQGPVYIGKNSTVKAGTQVYGGTTVGDWCKVGGELEGEVIFMPYSNKQHSGLFGKSYIGSWINVGGGTTTSDLKNTYGLVRPAFIGSTTPKPNQFYGVIIGDHSSTSINSSLHSGAVIGVCCNIMSNNAVTGLTKSFSWLSKDRREEYLPEKAAEVAGKMMARRKVEFDESYSDLLKAVKEETLRLEK